MFFCFLVLLTVFAYKLSAFVEENFDFVDYEYEERTINISYTLKPKLIIFDTDKTIWPFIVSDLEPPFNKTENGEVVDAVGYQMKPFSDIPKLFETLHNEGYKLGIAAESYCCEYTWKVFEFLNLNKHISYRSCYDKSKERLINVIHKQSRINYENMLYLTHDWQGIRDVGALKTVVILTNEEKGATYKDIERGLHVFKTRATVSKSTNNSTNLRSQMFINFK